MRGKESNGQKTTFQKELEVLARKKIVLLVLAGCLLFCVPVFGLQYLSLRLSAERHLDFLQNAFNTEYRAANDFLQAQESGGTFLDRIENSSPPREVRYALSQYNAQAQVQMGLVLLDAKEKVVYSSYGTQELTLHRTVFSRVVAENASGHAVYNTVYYLQQGEPEYVFCLPVWRDGAVAGYAVAFLSSSGWNRILSDYQYDTIITNARGNIIYCSKSAFLTDSNPGKFTAAQGKTMLEVNGVRYLVVRRSLPAENAVLYSLIYWPDNFISLLIGVLVMAAVGAISFAVFQRAAREMAEKNARSVEMLVNEIRIIRDGDDTHVIELHTGDEYEAIARQINKMVGSINQLNARNTELVRLNGVIELQNLQAQINPHFIYNTLDNIKYLIPEAPAQATLLIEKFANILRYSIANARRSITLSEDARYIEDYLYIQKTRFGGRFTWSLEIAPDCGGCLVPKLLIQPLIENSTKYGFARCMELRVDICCRRQGGYLSVSVADNGPGVSLEELTELRRMLEQPETESVHHGLRNVSRRLELQYGEGSGLFLESIEGSGFTVTARLRQEEEEHVPSDTGRG